MMDFNKGSFTTATPGLTLVCTYRTSFKNTFTALAMLKVKLLTPLSDVLTIGSDSQKAKRFTSTINLASSLAIQLSSNSAGRVAGATEMVKLLFHEPLVQTTLLELLTTSARAGVVTPYLRPCPYNRWPIRR